MRPLESGESLFSKVGERAPAHALCLNWQRAEFRVKSARREKGLERDALYPSG
jgi:hypothetical protein